MAINDFRKWLEEDDEDEKEKSSSNSLSTEQSTESQEDGTFESFKAWLNTAEEDTSYQEKMEESVKPTEEAVKPEEERVGFFKKVGNFVKDITLGKRKEGDKRSEWQRFQEKFIGLESKGGKENRKELQQYYDNLKTGKEKVDTLKELEDMTKLKAYQVLKERVEVLSKELGTHPQIIGKDYEKVKGRDEYIALKKLEAELGITFVSDGVLPKFFRNIDLGFAKGNAFNEEGYTIATPAIKTSTLKQASQVTKKLKKEGWEALTQEEQGLAMIDYVVKMEEGTADKTMMDKVNELIGSSLGWGSSMATSFGLVGGSVPDPASVSTGLLKTLEVAGVQAVRAMNLAPHYTSEIDKKYLDLTTPEYAYFVDKTGDIILEKLQDARYSEEEQGFGVVSEDNKAMQMAKLSNFLEVYSESWGQVLGTGGEEFMNSLIKTKVFGSFANWMRKTGKLAQGTLYALLKQAKFDGVVGEFLEEELLNPLQSAIERTEYQGIDTKEGRERMLIEILGFGATQSGAMIQGYVQNKDKGKAIDFINNNKEKFGLGEDKALDKEGNLYDVDSGEIIVPKEEVMKEPEPIFGDETVQVDPVVDVEEEMLKADIAQAESGLVAEPVQEVKIEEGEVKTDYSQDAQVQEVLRDISLVLDAGARKKVVSKVEGSEGMGYDTEDYTYGVEGMAIPEFIPEELRSRKIVEKAYNAFLNNTIPQEGTKAWQVYQAILDESKGREGLEIQKPEVKETPVKSETVIPITEVWNKAQEGKGKYFYHGTNEDVLDVIVREGLKPMNKGTLSLSKDESYAKSFAREGITPEGKTGAIMLRVNSDLLKDKTLISDKARPESDQMYEILTKETIPPEALEIYKDGKWQPLKSKSLKEQVEQVIEEEIEKPKTQKEQVKEGKFALKVEKLRKDAPAYITDLKVSDEAVNVAFEKLTGADIDMKDIPADLRAEVQKVLNAINGEMDKRIAEDTVLQREMEGGFTKEELAGYLAMDVLEDREYEAEMQKEITPSEEDVITDDDLPFRQRELKVLEDKFLDNLNIERMKEFSREWFGDENVEVVKNILRNKKALGMYLNRLIEIKNGQAHVGSTFYHEAVHKAFDIFLTPAEKKAMVSEVIKRVGKKELLEMYNSKSDGEKAKFREMYFKHGTKYDIVNGFNLDYVGKGEGNPRDAHALYLTENILYAKDFANSQFGRKDAKVYDVKVDIDPAMMLRFGTETEGKFAEDERFAEDRKNPYWKEWTQRMKILDGLMDKWKEDNNIDYRKASDRELRIKQEQKYRKNITDTTASMEELYNQLSLELGSKKNASEFLASLGFDGILQTTKGGLTIGLFDTGKIKDYEKISNIQEAMYRGGNDSITLEASAQEWLAENIIDYINNRNSTTFWGKLKRMVDIFVDRVFRGIDHVKDIEDFYESLISGRLLDRQEKIEAKRIKNFNKYLTSIAGAGTKTDVVYRMEVAKEVKKLTTKILKKLEGKASVKKQFISDLTKQQDIKQVEKDIINDVLKKFPDEIDVATFEEKVLAELLPLKRAVVTGNKWYDYTLSEDRNSWDYSEAIYYSPIPTMAGSVHFKGEEYSDDPVNEKAVDNYFGHIRIQTSRNENIRRIAEVQNDLYQRGRIENETTESKIEVFNNQVKNIRERLNKQIKLLEATYNELKLYKTETSEQELANIQSGIAGYKGDLVQIESKYKKQIEKMKRGYKQRYKLSQYNNPTAHFRTVREEIRQAVLDGMEKILFPSGETAMHIEHLAGQGKSWVFFDEDAQGEYDKLTKDNIKVGSIIIDKDDLDGQDYLESRWVVAHVFGDTGDFIAVPAYQEIIDNNEILYNLAKKKGYYMTGEEADEMGIYSPYDLEDDVLDWDATFADKEILKLMMDINLGEQFNTSDRQEINKEHGTYLFYENTLSKYLKSNYEAKLITDKNGYTWWEVELKPEYAGAVEAFRTDELVDYRKVAEDLRIRPQVGGVLQPLVTLHNISAENLLLAQFDGKLPAPSLAVTKPENPIRGFGEITLVGGRDIVDPEANYDNRLYSHDIYSPRVPAPEYKINNKEWQKFYYNKEIQDVFDSVDSEQYSFYQALQEQDPRESLMHVGKERSHGMKALYLKERGVEIPIVYKPANFPYQEFINTKTFKKNEIFLMGDITAEKKASLEKKKEIFKEIVKEEAENNDRLDTQSKKDVYIKDIIENYTQSDLKFGDMLYGMYKSLRDMKELKSGDIVDRYETKDAIQKKVEEIDGGSLDKYNEWVEEYFEDIFSEPYITIGGKKEPYTTENKVRSMFGKGVKAQEGGIFSSGVNRIKAIGAKKYSSIEQAKRDSYGRLVSEAQYDEITSRQYSDLEEKAKQLGKYNKTYGGEMEFDYVPTQTLEYALADYAKGSKTMASFLSAFRKNGYEFDSIVDEYLIEKTKRWADRIFTDPVPYLEAKPKRAVALREFSGAIMPSYYQKETNKVIHEKILKVLNENGIDRIFYVSDDTMSDKSKIINEKFEDVKYRLADNTSEASQEAELESTISVKLPELITMATELGANIKLQKSFRKGGKLGDFTAGEDTDSRIRILRTLFEPQGEEVMDGEGNVEKLPETPEQQMDRIHGIEKVLAHEIGHLFDWFGGENNMTLKRGNILGRIANLRSYTEGQFMDLENKEVRKELKTLTQVWNPFDEASVPKKYKTYRYSAKELYAEALSVFLNKPSLVKEVAPNFYQGFVEYMARKKEVQKEYFAIRDMIKQGNEVQSRVENMKKAQEIARGKRMTIDEEKEAYRKQSKWQEGITGIKMGFVNQYAPYLDKLRKAWKDKKITLSKLEEAEQLMGDLALKGNDAVKYAQDVQDEFFVPVSEAGIDIDTVGQILVLERNLGDRLDLANPHGLVYDYAKETYDYVKGQLSPAQWNLLSEKLSWWRDYNFELVKKGYEAGVYSEKFFEEIATVNKNTYTPFAVVDYIEDNYVTAGVIQAVGTTKGVENPLTTQMLKSLSLMKLTATNGAKQDVVKSLSEIFPDEIVKADAIKDADGRTIGFKKNPKLERSGYTQLEILEDGKRTAYYMDKYIVSMFESSLNGVGWEIARFVTAPLRMVNRIFKPAVTVMKASFQFYSNPLKDYQRSLTNLTALSGLFDKSNVASRTGKVFTAFTKEWVKNLKRSWNYAGGEIDAVTQKMLDMYVLSSNVKYEDIDIGNEKFKFDPVKNRIVYKGGVNWLETLRDFGSTIPVIKHTLVPVYDFYMRAGSTFEVNSKIAGFQYLSEKVGEEKASFYTRRYVGTPDYMQKGKFTPLTNELVVFSNVGIQAITADMDLATRPKTASGYWISTMFKIVFPKLLMLLGASILRVPIPDPDDPEKKKWVNPYDYLSEYYKSMYMAFPIGYDKESESFMFVKAPSDEVGAVIGNLVWKMATYLQGEGMKVEQLGSAIAGLIPFTTGDNPLLSIGRDWMQYAQGRNPYDDFRGRLAINTSKWNEGGMTRFTEMLKWTGNEMGLTNFSTYDNSSDTTLEKTMNLPLLERMFELTNYGLQEREENDKALGKKEKNKTLDGYIESYYAEPSNKKLLELQEKYVIAIKGERPKGGWSGTEKAEETRLKSEFKREVLANSGNAQFTSIAKSGLNNDEKIKIMDTKTKNSSDSQKAEYLSQVVKYEVVKGELFAQYAKDKDLSDRVVYEVVKQSIPVLSAESNNDLLRELRQAGVLSDRSLAQLRNDGLITPAGYNKYRAIKGEEVEQQQSGRIKRPERQYF